MQSVVALVIAAAVGGSQVTKPDCKVRVSGTEWIEVDADVASVQVEQPEIISADFAGNRVIKLYGRAVGATGIILLDGRR